MCCSLFSEHILDPVENFTDTWPIDHLEFKEVVYARRKGRLRERLVLSSEDRITIRL